MQNNKDTNLRSEIWKKMVSRNGLPYIFLLVGLMVFLITSVLWINVILLLFYGMYLVLSSWKKNSSKNGFLPVLRAAATILTVFLAGIVIRFFFIEIYAIPSSSMESALIPGDKILVDKVTYGPKMPQSPLEIPWLNMFFYLNADAHEKIVGPWWEYKRLSGFSRVEPGDVVVFKASYDDPAPLIKRCAGISGDTLQVKDGLIIGHENEKWIDNTLVPVRIVVNKESGTIEWLDSLKGKFLVSEIESHEFKVNMPAKLLDDLKDLPYVDSVFIIKPRGEIRSRYFKAIDSTWSLYNFGPIRIPRKGDQIRLDKHNYALYKGTIDKYEGTEIKVANGRYFQDNREIKAYTFKNDYYFMMGDNRENSRDSRYIGFIPEQNIIGHADVILFSSEFNVFKWERLLKTF